MSKPPTPDAYGELIEPATLKIQRLLPGPIERVWAYLTQSELRRQWLAVGDMEMKVGASFELVWRNDELSNPPGKRPQGFEEEHRMQSRIVACDAPHRLVFTWQRGGEVSFDLEARGSKVLLTVVHRRLPDRATMVKVAAGWHGHLDVWVARATGAEPDPFWDRWLSLKDEYDRRLPA
jgi:uncharacterized protein YndB with AHSA1/START domain